MPTKLQISLDAEQYHKDLETVIGETRQAAAKMSADLNSAAASKVEIAAEVSGKEKVEDLAKSVEAVPAEKTILVKADVSPLVWAADAPEKTIQVKPEVQDMDKLNDLRKAIEKLPAKKTVSIPVKTFGGELKKTWTELRQQLNDFSGGAKKLMSTVLGTGGGPIGIFAAALASLWKIAGMYLDRQSEKMKEVSEQAKRNASNIADAAAVNEQYRQAGEGALRKLSELSNVEKLSNVQKAEAVSLIAKLTRQYGDLGISIDRASGKITGLDRAMVTRLQKDRDRRIREMEGQLKELRSARDQQDKIIADAGYAAGWKDEEGRPVRWGGEQKAKEAQQERDALDKQILDLMIRLNKERSSDSSADYLNRQSAANADIEAQTRAREKDLAKRQWQDKVNAVDSREDKIALISNRMLLNGDYEAYEAEKLRIEAKQKGLQLTKEESEEIRKQRELLKQQKLQASNRDKAQDLKWQMMEKVGQGKEASEQRALRDAERTKGSKLTDSEIDATKKLNELVWNMSNMRDQQFGDLSIKTNSLTARGGFQGAAVVPDSDKYNREISMTNKTMLGVLQRIERLCDKFGKF